MCWIFAYIWDKKAVSFLVNGIRNLEYRWYDSAWIVCINKSWDFYLEKALWKVSNLSLKVEQTNKNLEGFNIWIAHTRWATHGWVTMENCHPHSSSNDRFFVVHNWIIENFIELKDELKKNWISFYWDTDSEVIAKLIETEFQTDLETTIKKVTAKLIWAYALAVIDKENPEILIWAKIWSPLVIWFWKNEFFLSSDPNALKESCDHFIPLEDSEIVIIKDGTFNIFNLLGEKTKQNKIDIDKKEENRDLWDFEHYMLKEIHEIPSILKNALAWRIDYSKKEITSKTLEDLNIKKINKIQIIASWTSYNAWLTAQNWFEELADIEVSVYVSTEFKYKKHFINKETLYIFISQSWETADSLECLKIVKKRWWLTFWIINSVGSSIARLTDMWLYTHSWVEIGVASTKAFVWQLAVLLLMALSIWSSRNLDYLKLKEIIEELEEIPNKLESILKDTKNIKSLSEKYSKYKDMFFLWRNLLFPIAMEWSLKLKEITYRHSEAYSAWELKHWPLSLIDKDFPTLLINPKSKLNIKNISTLKEIQARDGLVIWVISNWDKNKTIFDDVMEVPETIEELNPFLVATSLNLFAYYMALHLDRDIDKPRNLAKSVTVE
jgi:glucosamine--fructose-6-phosphate aminotransferase (isomerizing)